MESEPLNYPDLYYNIESEVFAPEYYYRGRVNDIHTRMVLASKTQDYSNYFIPKISDVIKKLKASGKLGKIDLIITIPKSNLGHSPTLEAIGKWLATYLSSNYEQVIERIVVGRRNLAGNCLEKRYNQTNGSMKLKRKLKNYEKSILLVDDNKVTGITLLESIKILKEGGADKFCCICLGINRNLDLFPLYKMGG